MKEGKGVVCAGDKTEGKRGKRSGRKEQTLLSRVGWTEKYHWDNSEKKKRILLAAPEKVERTDRMNGYENGCKRVYSQYRKGIRATIQLRGRRRKK